MVQKYTGTVLCETVRYNVRFVVSDGSGNHPGRSINYNCCCHLVAHKKKSKYNFNTTSKCHTIRSQLAVVILDWILCAVFTSHNKTVTTCRHQTFYSLLCENGAFSVFCVFLFFKEQMAQPLRAAVSTKGTEAQRFAHSPWDVLQPIW